MLDRTAVGRTTPPKLNEVERGAVRRFAESVGDLNPLSLDVAYARAHGFSNLVAPPTFALSFDAGGDLRSYLGAPLKQLVLAEVSVELERPIVAGDSLHVSARVCEVTERQSPAGKVEVAVIEDEGRDEKGAVVYRLRRTYVRSHREGA